MVSNKHDYNPIIQKLYVLSEQGPTFISSYIRLALSMMEAEFTEIVLQGNQQTKDGNDGGMIQRIQLKSFSNEELKFPILELEDEQTYLSDPLSIFQYVGKNKYKGFYDHPMVDQWINIISQRVHSQVQNLLDQIYGNVASEIKSYSQQQSAFRKSIEFIEKHLKLRNYLVGHQMTLADVYLTVLLI